MSDTLAVQITALWVLNGVQGCLVLVVLVLFVLTGRRLGKVELTLERLPEMMRKHDEELVKAQGLETYNQISRLLYENGQARLLGGRRSSDEVIGRK